MNTTKDNTPTYRILIVDDNPAIHEDFRKIIETVRSSPSSLDAAEAALFGEEQPREELPQFEIDSAFQGQEALAHVVKARNEGRPYAMAFVDVRMPPGWDGVETIGHLWNEDPDLQVVICTAYSDYSWDDILKRFGRTDKLLILKKPFDNMEARQFACALTEKWSLTRQARANLDNLQEMVTERTAELESSLSLTKATLESTADGILMVSNEGSLLSYNQKFLDMWNLSTTTITGWDYPLFQRFVADQVKEPPRHDGDGNGSEAPADSECFDVLEFKDGRIFERYSVPQQLKQVTAGRVFSFRDVTKRHTLENQLRQSQKMEAIGQLAGGVAHDFNNILTVITGYGNLILQETDQETVQNNAKQILKASDRAAALTSRLLAFSRKQVMQPKVLDLNALIEDLTKMLARLIGEDIKMTTVTAPDLWPVKVDPGQIEQVILNLAVNARDAMPQGGQLTIATSNVPLANGTAFAPELPVGDCIRLSVTDTGAGMTDEVKRHLFEPFFTTKGVGKGTGLGLASCHGIIKQSGGHISAYSELGHGTTFKIYLPRVAAPVPLQAKQEAPPAPPARGVERILFVEDEPALRELAGLVLRDLGYTVFEASNGREALRAVAQQDGQGFDLLVTDVVMPELGGKKLADQFRITNPRMKVLFCSGYTNDALVHHGVLEPGIQFLQKPYTMQAMAQKVRELLDH